MVARSSQFRRLTSIGPTMKASLFKPGTRSKWMLVSLTQHFRDINRVMGGGRNPPLRRIDGDSFHPQRGLAGQEMVVKRLRSDRRDQWPDFSSPYAGYSFLQSLSGS